MQTMKYSYRLYPTPSQERKLVQFCGAQRWVWNHFLAKEMEYYKETKKFRFMVKNANELPEMKKQEETSWLKEVPSTSLQQTLGYLETTILSGARKQKGFAKFKKKKWHQGSMTLSMVNTKRNISLNKKYFKMPKIGAIRFKLHRDLPSDFSTCHVKQKAGKWYVVFTVKVKKQPKLKEFKHGIGIDLNSKDIAVTSDNFKFQNPKFFAKAKRRIRKENQKLSRKTKGSANWVRQLLRLQRAYDDMSNKRHDFLHQLSWKLVNENDFIAMETLNIKAMQKFNGSMVQDAGWSALIDMIKYKCDLYGKEFDQVSQWFPSTKMCSDCGQLVEKKLNERTHKCNCGFETSRDHNAAINIKNEFLRNRAGTARINACGDTTDGDISSDMSSHVSLKQEAATLKQSQ